MLLCLLLCYKFSYNTYSIAWAKLSKINQRYCAYVNQLHIFCGVFRPGVRQDNAEAHVCVRGQPDPSGARGAHPQVTFHDILSNI